MNRTSVRIDERAFYDQGCQELQTVNDNGHWSLYFDFKWEEMQFLSSGVCGKQIVMQHANFFTHCLCCGFGGR